MKKILHPLIVLLITLFVPMPINAEYVQIADGVYQDGSTLYISSDVATLGDLQVNPSVIYCYATIPPACVTNTFTGYDAELHVPASGMVSYFTSLYWYNFTNVLADAVEPQAVTLGQDSFELEIGHQYSLNAGVSPGNATPNTVYWSSTNTSVATVSAGKVTAVGVGECYICANCVDKQAMCHVIVTPERVTITLDRHAARLLPNHVLSLMATCTPVTNDLVVSSSDLAVAIPRFVNGMIQVIGVAEGTAIITVVTTDGWCHAAECEVTVYTEFGDVNRDGFVNIGDVTNLIDYLLSGDDTQISMISADTNRDGNVSIGDVTALIDYLLSGKWPWDVPVTETFIVNGVTFKMIVVEGGTFTMGATAEQGSDAFNDEKPTHEVTLSSYCIGETEVTQELWQAVMDCNPSSFVGNLQCPVETVTWNDCQEFISKLNLMTGKLFRLPTVAEWEFAARGGNKSQYYKFAGSNTLSNVAWYESNSSLTTHVVAAKAPNELALYDMSGNVREWCQDWYNSYSNDAQTNPTGPSSGSFREIRGGDWCNSALCSRVSHRFSSLPTSTGSNIGLRLALDEENSSKFRLSETVVKVLLGQSKSVDFLNGSGSYTIEGGTENIIGTINGNQLIVRGSKIGTTTITITDCITNVKTTLVVIVTDSETFSVSDVDFKMIGIEGGTFTMGATAEQGNSADNDEYPTHEVTLSSYAIGETEVTQELWVAVMGTNPSYYRYLTKPVEKVTWNDCQTFITKLNQMTGMQFRLPTEAEWEYAARGGNKSLGYKYAGSNTLDDVASTAIIGTQSVASFLPNELGLYDMSGNVWEWCQDWYSSSYYNESPQINPTGPNTGTIRVRRGGSWADISRCRVSNRNDANIGTNCQGLRLAL